MIHQYAFLPMQKALSGTDFTVRVVCMSPYRIIFVAQLMTRVGIARI